ncbi:RAD52 motif-containing protein 1-like [Amphiura filiformis]|uniref:RAD52 motif-containing protein 1-like n=1 Tax=Amphiura filiformis TaxID=82378 RepID=UPI003B2225DD
MASSLEIIEFKRPDESEKNLYVTGISKKLSEQEVHEHLYQLFSSYGALYDVVVNVSEPCSTETQPASTEGDVPGVSSSTNQAFGNGYYAYVKFYSSQAALNAILAISGRYILKGQLLKVKFGRSYKPAEEPVNLSFNKCCELASYYLGFNGWCSKILSVQEDKDDPVPNTVRFIGQVMIEVRGHSMQSEGVGLGEFTYNPQDVMSRMTAIHRAKKLAYMRACQSAFGKLLLVVLPNGKVAVEVDCTQSNRLDFATDEELQGVVKVNQLEPPVEEGQVPEDSVQGTDNLDDINAQLLLDLQADID